MNRRGFLRAGTAACLAPGLARRIPDPSASLLPLPSTSQLEWQRDELAMFIHFGVNTFTDREWGDGTESPSLFAPTKLDARQWARTARAAGFRSMILTAKHHDGFCLWPTRTTPHSVSASPFRGGDGDLVREFVDACRAEGLRPGLYLSPWDRNHPAYGDSPRYNDVYIAQLTELLGNYGPLAEVWFDGANGEGPNGRRQSYDWPRFHAVVRELQPDAVMFSNAGPDVRWCGNEDGIAGDPCWSMVDPGMTRAPDSFDDAIREHLLHGSPNGSVWRPAESDTSIRPGWFHHASENSRVRSPAQLESLYFSSVGRNAKLLLNVPPDRSGLLHENDVRSLRDFRERLDERFAKDVTTTASTVWRRTGTHSAELMLSFETAVTASIARLEEDIETGQRVAAWTLMTYDGLAWQTLASGTTVGYARLVRFRPATIRSVRLLVDDALEPPEPLKLRLFAG